MKPLVAFIVMFAIGFVVGGFLLPEPGLVGGIDNYHKNWVGLILGIAFGGIAWLVARRKHRSHAR